MLVYLCGDTLCSCAVVCDCSLLNGASHLASSTSPFKNVHISNGLSCLNASIVWHDVRLNCEERAVTLSLAAHCNFNKQTVWHESDKLNKLAVCRLHDEKANWTAEYNVCDVIELIVISGAFIGWSADGGHGSSHTVRCSSQISDSVRILSQTVFRRKRVITALLELVSPAT